MLWLEYTCGRHGGVDRQDVVEARQGFAQKIGSETIFCAGSTQNYGCELAVDADWRARPGVVGEAWRRYRDLTSVSVAMCNCSSSVIWVKPRIADSARSRCMAPSMAVKTALGS